MKIYDGAMLHGVNKQNVASGELGKPTSLDLGMIPEEVVNEKISPLIVQLAKILEEYKIYVWMSTGYYEDKDTDNEV